MNCMNAYLSLVDCGYPIDAQEQPFDPQISMMHMLAYALVRQKLHCDHSWRLAHDTSRELEKYSGIRPTGGWRELCSLAAGARYFRATGDAFIPVTTLEDVIHETTETIRTRLLESFTVHLAPPSSAASLFLLLGIHPVWGLRLAHASLKGEQNTSHNMQFGERDETVFPITTLKTLQDCVYGMLACVVATLRNLDPEKSYSIDALTILIDAAAQHSRRQAEAILHHNIRGLPVFLSDDIWEDELNPQTNQRAVEITTRGYIEQIFVPAGAMRRFEDGTFTVFEGAFENIQVGKLDDTAQNHLLSKFLSDVTGQHQVA